MAKDNITDNEQSVPKDKEQEKTMSKQGKIFLLVGIILLQTIIAYLIVANYYAEIHKFVSSVTQDNGLYYSIENLIINPAESRGERYLLISITFEMDNSTALSQIENKNAQIVDRINTLLSQRTVSQVKSINDRIEIKKEIIMIINELLNQKAVRNLYFTKFVMQ